MFGLGGAPCAVRLGVVVDGLLVPLLWRYQEDRGLCKIVSVVHDYGMKSYTIVFDIKFDNALTSYLENY